MNIQDNVQPPPPPGLFEIRDIGTISTGPDEVFDRLTRMATQILKTPIALISLINEETQFLKSSCGLPEGCEKNKASLQYLCKNVITHNKPLIINDAQDYPLLKSFSEGVRSYIGIPITLKTGVTIGSFSVLDHQPRFWSDQDIRFLSDFTQLVINEIELKSLTMSQQETVAIVTHDLKNPLFAIELASTSSINIINNSLTYDPRILRSFVRIKQCTERMQLLIKGLLDQYRLEKGPIVLDLQIHAVETILKDAVDSLIPIAEDKGVILNVCEDIAGLEIYCDKERMIQVFSNLIANAIQHTPTNKMVRVTGQIEPKQVIISVSDEGPGIPPSLHKYVFDKFWQNTETKSNGRGHGLGLYIVSKIVKCHGGSVSVENNHIGSTFKVSIPHLTLH